MRVGIQTTFLGERRHESVGKFVTGVGRALEERGFSTLWTGEHVVTFPSYDPAYPYSYADNGRPPELLREFGFLDPMSMLTALCTTTSKLRLGTGVAILPQRNPVYFAKMATGIDLLSDGRFLAGVGVGWSGQEFQATATPFERRGARLDEYIQIVQTLWQDDVASFKGEFYQLPPCNQLPRPIQRPHPPIYIGGESDAALRRVARFAQGWYGFRLSPQGLAARLPALKAALADRGREIKEVEIVVSPGMEGCSVDDLPRYAELGVSELVLLCVSDGLDSFVAQLDDLTERFVIPARGL